LLPAGPAYLAHARRVLSNRTLAEDIEAAEKAEAERALQAKLNGNGNSSIGLELELGDEEEDPNLLSRDPKEWKTQDHYSVLGLQQYRYKATDEQIKIARELFVQISYNGSV
jgi:DnaJ homolog subfamily C member 2